LTLICDHLVKCWWNDAFGEDCSTVVNYDWYHATDAYRYLTEDLEAWFVRNDIAVLQSHSTSFQHFLGGVKKP